jgi:hypothetical protein
VPRSKDGRWTRVCEVCGEEFQALRTNQRTCPLPKPCRARLPHNTGGSRAKADLAPRICQNPECGIEFIPVRENQIAHVHACLLKCPSYIEAQREHDRMPARRKRQNELRRSRAGDPKVKAANRRQNLARHGITPEEYDVKLASQDGRCAICGNPPNPQGIRAASCLHLDHDHATGVHRDLLCVNCNQGLGRFKDDPDLLRAAADYIGRHRVITSEVQAAT